ncbi:MAG TPA: response regulator [Nitrososphaera sp.]|nr:response regulator [Nitrososphaera sp.]
MKILVAEDDFYAAELYKAALESNGHDVLVTFDGQECLRQYREGSYDVVILDYKLPVVDGLKVAKQILFANPEQRVIFLSAFATEILADAMEELDKVIEVLPKPFEPDALVEFVENSQ